MNKQFAQQLKKIEPDIKGKARAFRIPGMDFEDVEQELRIHLMNKFDLWDEKKSSFRTWAVKVMRNRLTNLARDNEKENNIIYASSLREKLESKDDEDLNLYEEVIASDEGFAAKEILRSADNATILDAVDELPRRQREVVKLHIYEDYTFKEIAEELGIKASTARRHWQKAKDTLGIRLTDFAL